MRSCKETKMSYVSKYQAENVGAEKLLELSRKINMPIIVTQKQHKEQLNMETTYTRPPKEILDVLHEAEAAGVELPKIVDDWWAGETEREWDGKKET